MVHIEHETAKQLALDITSTHLAIDKALADLATLTYSVIDACRHSDASLAQSQAVIEGVANGLKKWSMRAKALCMPTARLRSRNGKVICKRLTLDALPVR